MKNYLLILFLLCGIQCFGNNSDIYEAKALLERIAPQFKNLIYFEKIDKDKDFFELSMKDGGLTIKGNSANSMAVGLNHYLKYYCHTSVSWYLHDTIDLPTQLPTLDNVVRLEARIKKRFFLNYCTFGYTMVWWKWKEWERFIDWMALNGINMPLAITGQEVVWLNVWKKLGLKESIIKNYFTGPAHLPWHRMSNFDKWQGNLPDSWLDTQKELQEKILARERSLNMTPVLPAFAGHVPSEIKDVYPNAKITQMSSWGGFRDEYRSYFLDPLDPLFPKIQKLFLEEQTKLYGTNHIYGADPFNEIDSPSWEPKYLSTVSKTIYQTIKEFDSKAQWLQMTWLFYFDRKHWTNTRIDAFVNAIPYNKMILLDYFAENTEIWKYTNSYFGQTFVWCYLGNFGGNTMMTGNMYETGSRIENVIKNGGNNLWGIGSTLEAFDVNPFMYEYVFEKAWNSHISDKRWIECLADRRVGSSNPIAHQTWKVLIDSVYTTTAQLGQGALTNARPSLYGHGNWTTNPKISYQNRTLFKLWEDMLSYQQSAKGSTYSFDVVNIGRQVLSNHFIKLRDEFTKAYTCKDLTRLNNYGDEMNELLDDLEMLLSTTTTFSLSKWLNNAASFGINSQEQVYYTKNARNILTTWGEKGQSLNDYANRSWSGLTSLYYHKRWSAFINEIIDCVNTQREFNQKSFNKKMIDLEQRFVDTDIKLSENNTRKPIETAYYLMLKYKSRI